MQTSHNPVPACHGRQAGRRVTLQGNDTHNIVTLNRAIEATVFAF